MAELTIDPAAFAGSAASGIFGMITAKKNRDFQREMWEDQKNYNTAEREAAQEYNTSEREAAQNWNFNQWQAQNEYNTPSAMMSRLQAAGINPNAIVGMLGGSVASNVVGSSGASSPSASAIPQFMDQINPFGGLADLALIGAQARKANAEAQGQEIHNKFQNEQEQLTTQQMKTALSVSETEIKKMLSEIGCNDAQRDQILSLTPLLVEKTSSERDQIREAIKLLGTQIDLTKQQQRNAKKQESNIDADTQLKQAQTGLATAQAGEADMRGLYFGEQYLAEGWRNACRQAGFDPNSTVGQNIQRLLATDPDKALELINAAVDAADSGFQKAQSKGYTLPRPILGTTPFDRAMDAAGLGH